MRSILPLWGPNIHAFLDGHTVYGERPNLSLKSGKRFETEGVTSGPRWSGKFVHGNVRRDIMKRMKVMLMMLGIVVLALAVACGEDDDNDGGEDSASGGGDDSGVMKKDTENPKYGGTIKVMTNQATPSLDPVTASTGGSSYALNWVYEKLFTLEGHDDDLGVDLVGLLAQSSTRSSDLMTYTIKLRQGIKWQDIPPVSGREFEGKDVVCTYQGYMQPTSVLYGQFNQVQSVEATDKYTVVVKLKEPNAQFIEETNTRSERVFPCDLSADDRRTKAIGTGPFIIKEFTPGATGGVKAERNPNYWKKDAKGRQLPYLDGYEYIANPENASKIAGLRSGQLHAADNLSKADVDALLGSNSNFVVAKTAHCPIIMMI